MIMICHCSLDCNKWPTVVQDVDSREGYMWRGLSRDIWDLSVLFAQFFCETKTSLKIKFTTKQTICRIFVMLQYLTILLNINRFPYPS